MTHPSDPDWRKSDDARPEPQAGGSDSAPTQPAATNARRTTRFGGWRGWLLRTSLLLVSPILFVGLVELGLRWSGYGYPTGLFLGPDADGVWRTNDRFGWRFFPRPLARAPHPCLLAPKAPGTIRIFVLGSSAAMGIPDPSFSFGRILEVMLRQRYSGMRFEVVNAAMTAVNSHVALEIARDCVSHEPDVFVVYMGNNEVNGPYGPGTVFQRWSPGLSMVRAGIWVKSMRVGQLLGDAAAWCRGRDDSPAAWKGMEMFLENRVAADDPRLPAVYDRLRRNLADLCGIARRAGAAVVLSTVAVNLEDCPPLASLHRAGLTAEEQSRWESHYSEGIALEAKGDWRGAVERYEAASTIDDRFAELAFRLGRCLAVAGRSTEARERFVLARDLDALRFRADSRINDTIREVATAGEADGVRLVDAEKAFAHATAGSGGLSGGDLFYEHAHLTFDGNYLLAKAALEQVSQVLAERVRGSEVRPVPSSSQCAGLLALTRWDEMQMAETMAEMTSRPPFTSQFDHASRQAAARRRIDSLRKIVSTQEALDEIVKTYESALARSPDDWHLHDRFARLATRCGRFEVAADHWRTVVKRLPWRPEVRVHLGNALSNQGRLNEAIGEYRETLGICPDCAEAHSNLGAALSRRGELDQAVVHLEKALEINLSYVEAHNNLGLVLWQRGDRDEATAHFLKALEIHPDSAEAHINLGTVLYRQGKTQEAVAHWREVIRLQPDNVPWLNQLASVLATCPIASVRNGKEAVQHARRAVALSAGREPTYLATLAAAYAETGQFAQAVETAHQALDLASRQDQTALANTLRAKIERYKAGSAFHNPP